MNVLGRLIIIGGGFALGLLAAGAAAARDKREMQDKIRRRGSIHRPSVRPLPRRRRRPAGTYV